MNINERIKEIRRLLCEDSNIKFATKLKKEVNTTSNYTRNGYSVGRAVTNDIITAFPEVNAEWLLTGEGEMLKSSTPVPQRLSSITEDRLLSIIESQQRTIEELSRKIK